MQPDGGVDTRSNLFGRGQHGQGCCWHVERTGEERVRKSGLVLPFTKREVPRGPFKNPERRAVEIPHLVKIPPLEPLPRPRGDAHGDGDE